MTPTSLSLSNGSAVAPRFTSSTNSGYFWDTAGTAGQAWSVGGSKKLKLNSDVMTLGGNFDNIGYAMHTGTLDATQGNFSDGIAAGTVGASVVNATTVTSTTAFDSKGVVLIADGSETSPSLALSSNSGTGLFRYGADTLGISAAGKNRVRIGPNFMETDVDIKTGTNSITCGSLSSGSISSSGDIKSTTKFLAPTSLGPAYTFSGGSGTNSGLSLNSLTDKLLLSHNSVSLAFDSTAATTLLSGSQLLLSGGSAAAPVLQMGTDPDTGLYHVGPDETGIAGGGAAIGRFSPTSITLSAPVTSGTNSMTCGSISSSGDIKSTSRCLVQTGTSTSPSYSFNGFTTSGMSVGTGNILNIQADTTYLQVSPPSSGAAILTNVPLITGDY